MDSVDISFVCFCMNNIFFLKKLRKILLMDVNIIILILRFYISEIYDLFCLFFICVNFFK